MDRRDFLRSTAAAGIPLLHAGPARSAANERLSVCVMGLRGRGGRLLDTFASMPDVEIAYVCDVDPQVLESRAAMVEDKTGRRPPSVVDYRRALDDSSVDILVIGTPDHWHALPAIHACQAGMDVYVEKPDAHNIQEGRVMVAAAHKYERVVQLGTQGRSSPAVQKVIQWIAEGGLGRVRFAKAWESARQGNIGHPPDSEPPAGVDYDRWLGPAPLRPFNIRRFHSSWRWFFDYGTGDLGNDGVHLLDFARWGLQTAAAAEGRRVSDVPRVVSAHGGKLYFDDAQEWPDTLMVTYDFAGCLLTYELRIWSPYPMHGDAEGAAVYGDQGYATISHRGARVFEPKGKQVAEHTGEMNDAGHVRNFLDCVRSRARPAADLATVGHPSSLLCHLGNAAWRAGRTLEFDAERYAFVDDPAADQYLTRPSYREPWVLPALSEI